MNIDPVAVVDLVRVKLHDMMMIVHGHLMETCIHIEYHMDLGKEE